MKKRTTEFDVLTKNGTFSADGCSSWFLLNRGNTNITIGGTMVLMPDESFASPPEHADVIDQSKFEVVFDKKNDPLLKAPDTGSDPEEFLYQQGVDPVPEKKNKLVIVRSYIK